MGSCYSCRSKEGTGAAMYTTVDMSTNNSDTTITANTKDKRKPPYARTLGGVGSGGAPSSSSSHSSFGFKRRVPAVLKSHSQERTGELVSMYETKIVNARTTDNSCVANVELSKPIAPLPPPPSTASIMQSASNTVSRFGYKNAITNNSLHHANNNILNGSDPNCNDISNARNATRTNSNASKSNKTQSSSSSSSSARNSPKRTVSKFGYKSSRDNSPDLKTTRTNEKRVLVPSSNENNIQNRGQVVEIISKMPVKVKTQLSGLPKPQIPVVVSKTTAKDGKPLLIMNANYGEMERYSLTTGVERMQISSENIPEDENLVFEVDSGLGNSVSDKKVDDDAETLAEVEQIEGDNVSISSRCKDRTPERVPQCLYSADERKILKKEENLLKKNVHESQSKFGKPSGIAKPKTSSLPAANAVSQRKAVVATSGLQQPKAYGQRKLVGALNANVSPKSSPKKRAAESKPSKDVNVTGQGKVAKQFGSNEWKIMKEMELKSSIVSGMEKVVILPISFGNQKQDTKLSPVPIVPRKSQRIESTLPTVFTSENNCSTIKEKQTDLKLSNSFHDDSSGENSLSRNGPYSPPSERDFFLIDDEIADQPALINCQSLDDTSYSDTLRDLRLSDARHPAPSMQKSSIVEEMNEEGGLPALAQTSSLAMKIPRRRSRATSDLLSPCSSIDSDDLMLDFDRTEDGLFDAVHDRSLEQSGVNTQEGGAFLQSRPQGSQPRSPAVGVILEEWGMLVGSHGTEGSSPDTKTKFRAMRIDSTSHSPVAASSNSMCSPLSESSRGYVRRTNTPTTFRPPRQISVSETEDGSAVIDAMSYRSMCQDTTTMKTMLLRMKRILQEADTLNPFESSSKTGLFLNLANSDPPEGVVANGTLETDEVATAAVKNEQENADLRRQVVFLQQQLEERDRTIKLLQQQMMKYSAPLQDNNSKEFSNAACQTERPKSLASSALSSSNEDNSFGNTVSFRIGKAKYLYGL